MSAPPRGSNHAAIGRTALSSASRRTPASAIPEIPTLVTRVPSRASTVLATRSVTVRVRSAASISVQPFASGRHGVGRRSVHSEVPSSATASALT